MEYVARLQKWHQLEVAKAAKSAKSRKNRPDEEVDNDSEATSCSSSGDDASITAALSYAALDGMDDDNSREWKKERKFKKMMGFDGARRMAQRIVREEREGTYQYHAHGTPGQKKYTSGRERVKSKCKEQWTRSYLPTVPPTGVTHIGLTCPPGRSCWVAQLLHSILQGSGKRPTRSMRFYPEGSHGASEHEAFQVVLQWLWAWVDTCLRISDPSVSGGPERQACVVAALQPCAVCANKEACSFMTPRPRRCRLAAPTKRATRRSTWPCATTACTPQSSSIPTSTYHHLRLPTSHKVLTYHDRLAYLQMYLSPTIPTPTPTLLPLHLHDCHYLFTYLPTLPTCLRGEWEVNGR